LEPQKPPPISRLPVELLSVIFEKYASEVPKPRFGGDVHSTSPILVLAPKPLLLSVKTPDQFPYNLASVCILWREVLATVPSYWTDVLIIVGDEDPTPLAEVAALFERSIGLFIEVHLWRKDAIDVDEDPEEYRKVRPVINLMIPHVHRCTAIHFDVVHGSSLPSVSRDLQGISGHLISLNLKCQTDDGYPPYLTDTPGPPNVEREQGEMDSMTRLLELSLHGYTIFDAIQHRTELFRESPKLQYLELAKFNTANHDKDRIRASLPAFFSALAFPHPDATLSLLYLQLPRLHSVARIYPISYLHIKFGNLKKNSMCLLMDHLSFRDTERQTITSCTLDGVKLRPVFELLLWDIREDLFLPLSSWDGEDIRFHDCSAISDRVLRHLGKETAILCLEIKGCVGFSFDGLRELVALRNQRLSPSIMDLVSITDPRRLPHDHQEWFRMRVTRMLWSVRQLYWR